MPLPLGLFYEGIATLFDRVFWLAIERHCHPELAVSLGASEVATLTVIGMLASLKKFNQGSVRLSWPVGLA